MPGGGSAVPVRAMTSEAQLIQDYLQSAGIFVNRPKSGPAGQVASLLDAEGQAEAVVIDPENNVFHACREPLSDSGWNMYGIGSGFSAIAAVDRATVWAVGTAGNVWRGARGRWSESTALPSGNAAFGVAAGTDGAIWAVDSDDVSWTLYARGVTASNPGPAVDAAIAPVLLVDGAGLLNFFCVDQQGGLWSIRQQTVGGGWGVWAALGQPPGGVTLTSIAVAPNQDGRLQVFAVGSSGGLHTLWQQIGSGAWSGWSAIAPQDPAIAAMAVGRNQDGRLEVFVVSRPDTVGNAILSHNWQTEPNGGWNGWIAGPVDYTSGPAALAVLRDGTGRLNLVLAPVDSPVCLSAQQSEPNDGWTDLVQIGGFMEPAAFLALGLDGSGRLNVLAAAASGAIQLLDPQQGAWWTLGWLDHSQGIAVGLNADGRLEVFGLSGGAVYHAWQESAGGPWSGWYPLLPACPGLASLAVTCNQAGSLEVIGLGGATSWRTVQDDTVDAAWLPFAGDWWQWYPMSGGSALASMPSGRADDFWAIRRQDGALTRWNGRGWTNTAIASGQRASLLAVDGEGTVWVLASDRAGSFYRLAGGQVASLAGLPGATSMGAARGLVWATAPGPAGGIALFTYRAGAWTEAAAPSLCDFNWNTPPQISVGRDGGVWMLDGGRNLWSQSMTEASWTWDAYPAAAGAPLRSLSAAKDGGAWGIDAAGGLWQFSSSWTPFSRPLPEGVRFAQISAGAPGTLWAIDAAGTPYSYGSPASGQAGGWQSVEGAFGEPLAQAPGNWALSRDAAYRYQPPAGSGSASWSPVADFASQFDARQISAGRDGTVVVLDTAGNLHALPPPAAPAALSGAPANLVQIAVVSADLVWALAQGPGPSSAYALHVYREGAWEQDTATVAALTADTAVPALSAAPDGTVWLLDGDGTPRRLNWESPQEPWLAKGKTTAVISVAAANGNAGAVTSAHAQAAWAVTAGGAFRRCVSDVWTDTYGALPGGAAAAGVSVGTDGSVWATDANGRLYRKQTWNQAPDSGLDGPTIVAAGLDGGGTLYLFTVDASGQSWCAQGNGANGWLDWTALPLAVRCDGLAAAPAANGVLNVFCLASGQVFRSDQDSGWGAFASLGQPGGVTLTGLCIGTDAVRQLYVFGLGSDGSVWFVTQDPSSAMGWGAWAGLPVSHPATSFAALGGTGNDPGGALELFALDDQGVIYHCWQSSSAPGGWSDWWVFGPGGQGPQGSVVSLSAGNQRNGPIHLAAIGGDGTVYATHGQPSSSTGWSGWQSLGSIPGAQPLSLALATGPDGVFNLFLRGSDGGVYNARPMLGWRDWAPLGATGTEGVAFQTVIAPADGTGAIRVIAGGGGGVWQTRAQSGTDSGWADWAPLSGPQPWMPCAAPAPLAAPPVGGAGALWAVFTDGSLRSGAGGSSWQQVAFPSATAPESALSVSVGTDGVVWAITATDCYRHVGSGWTHTAARAFRQAPVGSLTSLWAVDPQGGIWRSRSGGAVWWQDTSYGGTVRQLSACADGSIWLLDDNGVASLGAAWQRAMRPTNMPGLDVGAAVTQVAAGRDESGTRYLFLVAGGALYYTYELAYHSWLAPELLSTDGVQIGAIGVTNQQDTGALIAYATATCAAQGASQIGIATRAAGERHAFSFESAGAPAFASLELAAVDARHWYWFGVMGGSLYAGAGASGGVPDFCQVPVDEGVGPLQQLLPLPWPRPAAAPFCAAIDTSGQLWVVADIQFDGGGATAGNFLALTGPDTALPAGAAAYAALLQADRWTPPQPRIYAMAGDTQVGADPTLFVLGRRDLYRSPGDALGWWSSWLPLGGAYPGIFNGPPQAPTDTLFALDPSSSSLDTLRQNPATGKWTDGLVRRPSQSGDDFAEISVYATEASFADDYGNPQAGLQVTVFAETPVEAWVNNTLYRLDPFHGITAATDALGTLRIRAIAEGLSTPSLEFQVEGLNGAGAIPGRFGAGGATVAPSANVYAFLQGGGRLPLGGAPPAGLTGSALQAQFPGSYDGDTAASGIKAIASMPASATPEALAAALSIAIAVPHRGAGLSRRPGAELGSIFTRAWHDLKHIGETIYHAVKKAVVTAAIEIGQGVVSITLTIAGEVVLDVDMAIHKIEDAILAVEVFLTALLKDIEKGIEDFIDWLKLIFDLPRMRATQGYLLQIFTQALGALPPLIAHARATVDGGFTSLKEKLWGDFAAITGSGSPLTQSSYAPFSGLPSSLPSSQAGPARPHGPAAMAAQSDSGPVAGFSGLQNNWILRKVLDHLQILSFPAIAGVDPASFLTHLDLHDTASALQTAGQDLFAFIQTMAEHPRDLKSKGIVELLCAVEALITAAIDLIQALADDALTLVQAMVAGLAEALNTRLDIPFLDQLFGFLDEKPLTFLNLATLLLAVPSYILYQLAFPGRGLPFETAAGAAPAPLGASWTPAEPAPGGDSWTQAQSLAAGFFVLGMVNVALTGLMDTVTIFLTPEVDQNSAEEKFKNLVAPWIPLGALVGAACGFFMRILMWPDTTGFPNVPSTPVTIAEVAAWFHYAVLSVPPVYGLAAPFIPALGGLPAQLVKTFCGVAGLISGIVMIIEGLAAHPPINAEAAVQAGIAWVPPALTCLLIAPIREDIWYSSELVFDPAWINLVADALVGLAVPILHFFAVADPVTATG